jgi:xylulokinase
MGKLLGIDAGTTAMKVVLYNEKANPITSATKEYNLITPSPGIVETDPGIYWNSLKSAVNELFSRCKDDDHKIIALAISSQGESFITINKNREPLRNTIVWLDTRSEKESILIEKEFGTENVYQTTGSPEIDPTWASTKLLWMKKHEPEFFKKIYKVFFVEDYLIYQLTGNYAANGALYCSSLLFNIIKNEWWEDMLKFIGLSKSHLPELYNSGVKVGVVKENAAKELGFSNEPIVVSGGMDQACSCIGTGNIFSGMVTESTGASLNISVTIDKPVFDPKRRVPCQTHAVKGKYIYLPWTKTAGMLLKWFKDKFCEPQVEKAESEDRDVYEELTDYVDKISPGSDGLVVLPHLSGSISPEMDSDARGVIFGLKLSTTRLHIIKAILESIAYMSRSNMELIEESGIDIKDVILTGGASKSGLWNQIKADVLGREVKTIKNQDTGCLGAAILAGVGSGVFDSIQEACESVIEEGEKYTPNKKKIGIYNEYYAIYKNLYENLKALFKKLSRIEK